MKNKPLLVAGIGAALFAIIIGAIKYLTQTDITFGGLLFAAIFGAVISLLAFTKKSSWLKNTVFILAFIWILWAILNPIQTVGGNWVINKTYLLAIIALVIIMLEQNTINSVREELHKKPRFAIGFLGSIAIVIFLAVTHVLDPAFAWLGQHLWILAILLLGWFIFLYYMVTKALGIASNNIVGKLTHGRRK